MKLLYLAGSGRDGRANCRRSRT